MLNENELLILRELIDKLTNPLSNAERWALALLLQKLEAPVGSVAPADAG